MLNIIVSHVEYRTTDVGQFLGTMGDLSALLADGRHIPLEKGARTILYWGTTGGVSQLSAEGPTPKTLLGDPSGGRCLFPATHIRELAPGVWEKFSAVPVRR